MKTMFVLAHFDDETFGLSGYIQHLKSINDKIYILYLCKGRDDINFKKRFDVVKKINTDVEFGFLDNYDLNLFDNKLAFISSKIRTLIMDEAPERIITHCSEDLHQDHVFTSRAVKIALKRVNETCVLELLEFMSPDNYPFSNVYFDSVYQLTDKELRIKKKNAMLFKEIENIPEIYNKEYFKTIYRKLK